MNKFTEWSIGWHVSQWYTFKEAQNKRNEAFVNLLNFIVIYYAYNFLMGKSMDS